MNKNDFSKIVFILGAGTHVPYGFPTAKMLTETIKCLFSDCEKITSLSTKSRTGLNYDKLKICNIISEMGLVSREIFNVSSNAYDIAVGESLDSFVKAFGGSQMYSIDSYLAKYMRSSGNSINDNFPKIGKILIAYFILKQERATAIGFHNFDWIQFIINNYLRDERILSNFLSRPPSIFTFNYDNFLEHSLIQHLVDFHQYTRESAITAINDLKIKHIYGHIDSIKYEDQKQIFRGVFDNLFVIGEERNTVKLEQVSKEIAAALEAAKQVYFLGFGFDYLNSELIFKYFKKERLSKNHATSFTSSNIGFTKHDVEEIQKHLPLKINFFPDNEGKITCYQLLRINEPFFKENKKMKPRLPKLYSSEYL